MPGVLLYRCPSVSLWPILSQFALMKPTVANRCTQVLPIVAHPWPCPVNPVYCQPHKGLSQQKTAMSTREQSSGQTAPSSPFITLNLFLQDPKPYACVWLILARISLQPRNTFMSHLNAATTPSQGFFSHHCHNAACCSPTSSPDGPMIGGATCPCPTAHSLLSSTQGQISAWNCKLQPLEGRQSCGVLEGEVAIAA